MNFGEEAIAKGSIIYGNISSGAFFGSKLPQK